MNITSGLRLLKDVRSILHNKTEDCLIGEYEVIFEACNKSGKPCGILRVVNKNFHPIKVENSIMDTYTLLIINDYVYDYRTKTFIGLESYLKYLQKVNNNELIVNTIASKCVYDISPALSENTIKQYGFYLNKNNEIELWKSHESDTTVDYINTYKNEIALKVYKKAKQEYNKNKKLSGKEYIMRNCGVREEPAISFLIKEIKEYSLSGSVLTIILNKNQSVGVINHYNTYSQLVQSQNLRVLMWKDIIFDLDNGLRPVNYKVYFEELIKLNNTGLLIDKDTSLICTETQEIFNKYNKVSIGKVRIKH